MSLKEPEAPSRPRHPDDLELAEAALDGDEAAVRAIEALVDAFSRLLRKRLASRRVR